MRPVEQLIAPSRDNDVNDVRADNACERSDSQGGGKKIQLVGSVAVHRYVLYTFVFKKLSTCIIN